MIPNSFIVFCPGDLNMISITEIELLHHCFYSPFTVFSDSLVFGNWDFTLPPFYFLSPLIISETFLAWFWQHLEMKLTVVIMSKTVWPGRGVPYFFFSLTVSPVLAHAHQSIWRSKISLEPQSFKREWWGPVTTVGAPKRVTGARRTWSQQPFIVWSDRTRRPLLGRSLPSVFVDCHTLYTDSGGADGGSEIPLYFGRGRRSGGGRRESERGSLNQ